ncbi:RTA1 like protein-domain-containing protein [Schizophyllum commune]
MSSGYTPGSLWCYAPNKGAPIAFAILFLLSGLLHVYQSLRYHSWKVTGLLPWAAALFVAGFITREVGAYHSTSEGLYISSTRLLLIAPAVYEGANYFVLGRLLYYVPHHAPLHPGRVVTTFFGIDVLVGVLTGVAGSYIADPSLPQSKQHLGRDLLRAAMLLQLATMALFVGITVRFHVRCRRAGVLKRNLRNVLLVVYGSCAIITVRTVYRTVEYFEGAIPAAAVREASGEKDLSPIVCNEWFFWVFEATLMFMNSTFLNVFHPARFLPRDYKVFLARDGQTEIEGPGDTDKRGWIQSILDPFDLIGLVRQKDVKYWDVEEREMGRDVTEMRDR